jgi:glutamyl-tRNA synthetase
MTTVKTRFCPSPTGLMHVGNLRTALFSALLAHNSKDGQFLIRIEDTDTARSKIEYTEQLLADLLWLGISWEEGPGKEGKNGPYFQSQRNEIYEKFYQELIDKDLAYWCFCSEAELSIQRKAQLQAGQPPRYPGTCRHLTEEQINKKRDKGLVPALRLRVPDDKEFRFDDYIQGPKLFKSSDIGDFIIKKADGTASFMFCNAIDDALMGVNHALRGDDHITNTPRQLYILEQLGIEPPKYGHTAIILGMDGKPLSKRNGSQSVASLREQGYFPLAILNYLARLGHNFQDDKVLNHQELAQLFSVDRVSKSPAKFDAKQLDFWQKNLVLDKDLGELTEWLTPYLEDKVPAEKQALFIEVVKDNITLPQDAVFWAKQLFHSPLQLDDAANKAISEVDSEFLLSVKVAIEEFGVDYPQIVAQIKDKTGNKGKKLFMPIRALFTGVCFGPELAKIFPLIGREALLKRIEEFQD